MKANLRSLVYVSILSVFSISAMAAMNSTSTQNGSTTTASTAAEQGSGRIIKVLEVINTNEINVNNVALQRSSNPQVKDFAKMMVNAHTQNLQAFQALAQRLDITPVSTSKSDSLQTRGEKEVKALNSVASDKFDTTYVNAMVKAHQAALKLIDNKLLPNATNPQVKTLLTSTRATVDQHLQMAQKLQSQLKG